MVTSSWLRIWPPGGACRGCPAPRSCWRMRSTPSASRYLTRPGAMLKRQLAKLEAQGMRLLCASELEFYLFNESYETARTKRYHALQTSSSYIEDYHIFQTTKEEPVMRAIRTGDRKSTRLNSSHM